MLLVEQRGDGRLDGRARRAQVVRHRVEQSRLQTLALLQSFGLARALEGVLQLRVQTLDLVSPGVGLLGPAFRVSRKLTGGDGGEEE